MGAHEHGNRPKRFSLVVSERGSAHVRCGLSTLGCSIWSPLGQVLHNYAIRTSESWMLRGLRQPASVPPASVAAPPWGAPSDRRTRVEQRCTLRSSTSVTPLEGVRCTCAWDKPKCLHRTSRVLVFSSRFRSSTHRFDVHCAIYGTGRALKATLPPNAERIKRPKVSICGLFLNFPSKENDLKKFVHRQIFLSVNKKGLIL